MKNKLAALALVATLAAAVAVTYHSYRGAFRPGDLITIESGRAGLALRTGALVKHHGMEVGRVSAIHQDPDRGAVVTVRLDRDKTGSIPAATGADIRSTTIFGEKYITLTDPAVTTSGAISAGTVIRAASVTTEINSVFESLTAVLAAVTPEKLDTTLSAIATALRGNGADLGRAIDDANTVLAQINPRLPQINHDLRATADATTIYADAADDLVATLTNAATPAATLVAEGDRLDHTLLSIIGMADTGNDVLATSSEPLISALTLLRPTTDLLGEYSPMLTCFLQGADEARKLAEPVSGGDGATMKLRSSLLFGVDPYDYPASLPVVAATGGPRCGSLPKVTMSEVPTPYVVADIGANPFSNDTGAPRLVPGSLLDLLLSTSPRAPR
ncbi:MCE family protein [Nocardia sp. NPDC052112]|uniref:MCE family protein n=1 Tax=Nocardia sp. NPDC052112 TaxID=3155646 RepID=UPI003416D79B